MTAQDRPIASLTRARAVSSNEQMRRRHHAAFITAGSCVTAGSHSSVSAASRGRRWSLRVPWYTECGKRGEEGGGMNRRSNSRASLRRLLVVRVDERRHVVVVDVLVPVLLLVRAEDVLARVGVRADEQRGRAADDDERDDPAEDALEEDLAVDACEALEEPDADGRSDLAVRRRERPALRRAVDDDEGRAELDAVAARGRDGGE